MMKNGWTGGQYSLFRFFFGLYLFIHFFQLLPFSGELFSNEGMIQDKGLSPLLHVFPNILAVNDSPIFLVALHVVAMIASIFFMIGKWDRISSVILWYFLACLFGRNPLIANPSLPFVGWLLLAHFFIPKAPFGSLASRNRLDPKGGWEMPPLLFFSVWVVMSIGYTYSGILKLWSPSWMDGSALSFVLKNPLIRLNWIRELLLIFPALFLNILTWGALALEVFFAVFVLFKKIRPWAWLAMLSMHLGLLFLVNFADLTWGMIMLHFFTFDPGWIKPKPIKEKLSIFYDGSCGFCHSFIRFILAENKAALNFRFAPLQSRFPDKKMPNTICVQEGDELFTKSKAMIRILASLGGVWRIFSKILSVFPTKLVDFIYGLIAKVRYRLFSKPKDLCPIILEEYRVFFE